MAVVSVRSVTKTFGDFRALNDVTIDFANGGFYSLLGPSGCGKTTLLRLIAGFDFPTSGQILIAGEAVETIPVEKRNVGMMFQSYALFPNMSVFDNVAFGLSVRKVDKAEQRNRVGETLELVQLGDLHDRRPHQLSGGQRQRVALARAIVIKPRVLLLDEPLSALDKALRVGMQVELKRIQREVGITTIFVTHDQEEALTLSDKIGILKDGELVQQGTPGDIYERPGTTFAATFLGDANLFSGTAENGALLVEGIGQVQASNTPASGGVTFAVRPEKMWVAAADAAPDGNANMLEAVVDQHIFAGSSLTYLLRWQGKEIRVFAQNRGDNIAESGTALRVMWRPEHTIVVQP